MNEQERQMFERLINVVEKLNFSMRDLATQVLILEKRIEILESK